MQVEVPVYLQSDLLDYLFAFKGWTRVFWEEENQDVSIYFKNYP